MAKGTPEQLTLWKNCRLSRVGEKGVARIHQFCPNTFVQTPITTVMFPMLRLASHACDVVVRKVTFSAYIARQIVDGNDIGVGAGAGKGIGAGIGAGQGVGTVPTQTGWQSPLQATPQP
jgi:hypothetical protein